MPRVTPAPAKPPRRPPARRPTPAATLGEPRDMKDRPHGWVLALRRQRRRVRPVLYGLLVLAAIVSVSALIHASSRAASLVSVRQRFGDAGAAFGLRVQTVVVHGRVETPEPLLRAAIGITPGDPLLGYSVADARARVIGIASVQDATVERRWPATILVSLVERHAFAIWQRHGSFVLIDRDGAVLADQDLARFKQLPLVVGAGASTHAAALLDQVAAHPVIQSHLIAAVRVSDRRWNLRMNSGADVWLPEDGQDEALGRLDALQNAHRLLDRRLLVIDLRLADRTTLRPDPAALPSADPPHLPGGPSAAPPPIPATARQPT